MPSMRRLVSVPYTITLALLIVTEASAVEAIELAHQAYLATSENLVSKSGEGRYEVWMGKEDPVLKTRAQFRSHVHQGRFFLDLTFEKDGGPFSMSRQIAIKDQDGVFRSRFSEIIHPTGCEGDILPARGLSTVFPWDLCTLYRHALDVDNLLDTLTAEELDLRQIDGDVYRGSYRHGDSATAYFDIDPEFGYHVSRYIIEIDGRDQTIPYYTVLMTWRKVNGVWVIASFVEEENSQHAEFVRRELHYNDIAVNEPVDDALFMVNSLEMIEGSRILDHRQNAKQRSYTYAPTAATDTEHLDQLIAQIESMPVKSPLKQNPANSIRAVWVVAFIACVLIALGIGLRIRQARFT